MNTRRALLAGGCFWGMEELFRQQIGVVQTTVGYTGGTTPNPTYEHHEGHAEALEILFDDSKISYRQLLQFFFQIHNPCTVNRQGNDVGSSYRSAIFYDDDTQKEVAETLITEMNASGKWPSKIVTEITKAGVFTRAEDYHQNYLQKNPNGYTCHYVRPQWIL